MQKPRLNKTWTVLSLRKYVGYDREKKHQKSKTIARIALVPEVPDDVPADIAALLTQDEQVQTLTKLEAIRAEKPGYLLRCAAVEATAALHKIAAVARPGLLLEAAEANALQTAMAGVAGALADSPFVAEAKARNWDLVAVVLEATNELSDQINEGRNISRESLHELKMQLAMVVELLANRGNDNTDTEATRLPLPDGERGVVAGDVGGLSSD